MAMEPSGRRAVRAQASPAARMAGNSSCQPARFPQRVDQFSGQRVQFGVRVSAAHAVLIRECTGPRPASLG